MLSNKYALATAWMTVLPVAVLYVNCTSVYNQTEYVGICESFKRLKHLTIIACHLIRGLLLVCCRSVNGVVCGHVVTYDYIKNEAICRAVVIY